MQWKRRCIFEIVGFESTGIKTYKEMAKKDTALEANAISMDLYRMLAEGQKKEVKKILAEHPEWKQDEN